jgi:hypothetical protein
MQANQIPLRKFDRLKVGCEPVCQTQPADAVQTDTAATVVPIQHIQKISMKQNRIRYVILTIASSILVSQSAQATLIRSSQFVGYNTGNLGADAGTGTLDGWQNSTAQVTVTNGAGSLDGTGLGLVASAGDRIFISATDAFNVRNQFATNTTFPQANDTNLYFSFLYRFNSVSDVSTAGETLMRMNRANSGTGTPQHWDLQAMQVAGQIQLGISKAGAPSNATNYATTNISASQVIFVVVRQHIIPGAQNDVYDLWINPPPQFFGTNEVDIPPPSASVGALTTDGTEDSSGTGPGRLVIVAGSNSQLDEFRIATTWAEVTPWFGQCVSAGVAVSPGSVTNSAEINSTFKVFELGTSPTIQWQRSTNAGATWDDISGATSSTYVTPNLQLSDNGSRYRAIVSVACNSSTATSGVATVTLTTPTPTPVGVVMNDTFTDPDLGFDDRSNPPLSTTNSLWYTALAVQNNLTAFGQGGNMLGIPISGGSSLWLGYFTDTNQLPVHLPIGRAVKVTLPFTPNGFTSFTNNAGLRIGLFDYYDGGTRITEDSAAASGSGGNGFNVRGYMLNLDFGPTFSVNSPLQLLARNFLQDNNLLGTVADYESLGSGPAGGGYTGSPAFQAGTQYTLEFTVARTDVNSVDVTASITGGGTNWSHSVTETNYAYHRFDSFAIRPNSLETSADSFTFSEFKVDVIEFSIPVLPFNITSVQMLSPGSIKLTWDSVSGKNYQVQSTDALNPVNWTTNGTVTATGTSTSFTNSPIPGSASQFYRVVATP